MLVMGKVCLAMVVANEQPVIERCLDSCKNMIDQICISINGDDDDTSGTIQRWGEKNDIPTTIWFDPWDGYGPNKTRNLKKVREELETEYIIFIDADEVFVTDPKNPVSYPTKQDAEKLFAELDGHPNTDCFYMKTHYGAHLYDRWQIIRNNQEWEWRLPYQEYLVGKKSNNRRDIDWIFNYSRHEGHSSRHSDRRPNTERLAAWMEENPDSPDYVRACYYVGEAYQGLGEKEKAIEYFSKRLTLGGWHQERYMAAFYMAGLYKGVNDKKRRDNLLLCTEIDPRRLEAYHELLKDDRDRGKFRTAMCWAVAAPSSRVPPADAFPVTKTVYDYMFDYDISIAAYYAAIKQRGLVGGFVDSGLFQMGLDAINRCYDNLPANLKAQTNANKRFYVENLPHVSGEVAADPAGGVHRDTSIMILENFYENPDEIREKALGMEFNVKGNYPGQRTEPFIPEGTKERLEKLLNNKIVYWPDTYNGSFQYTTGENKSWIHRDKTEWSLVVYLTPNPPVDGGTKTYVHKASDLTKSNDPEIVKQMDADSNNHDAWHVLDKIGNRYNRAILFRGHNSHMSDLYFGTDKNDGRLFQTFFFNTAGFDDTRFP